MKKTKFLIPILTCSALALPSISLVSCSKVSVTVKEGLNVEARFMNKDVSIGKPAELGISAKSDYKIKGNTCTLEIKDKKGKINSLTLTFEAEAGGSSYVELELTAEQMTGNVKVVDIATDKYYYLYAGSQIGSYFEPSSPSNFISDDLDVYIQEKTNTLGQYLKSGTKAIVTLRLRGGEEITIPENEITWNLVNEISCLGAKSGHLIVSNEVIKKYSGGAQIESISINTDQSEGSGIIEFNKVFDDKNKHYKIETDFQIRGYVGDNYSTKIIPEPGYSLPELATKVIITRTSSRYYSGEVVENCTWKSTGEKDGSYIITIPMSSVESGEHLFISIDME